MTRSLRAAFVLGLASCAGPPGSGPAASELTFGYCGGIGDLAAAKSAGFDYVELPVRDIARMSDEEFGRAVDAQEYVGLPTPVANNFLPADLKIAGRAVDKPRQNSYLEKSFGRMARLGVRIVVLGSGDARRVPDGFPPAEAHAQLVEFGRRAAAAARRHGIVVAVEPLRKQETNIIHTAAEGLAWVKAVDHPNFQLMVDFYHLASEKEDPAILLTAKEHIRHFHMANPKGRVFPLDASEYDYAGFFANLRSMGFRGRMSVEAKPATTFAAEAPRTLAFLRGALR